MGNIKNGVKSMEYESFCIFFPERCSAYVTCNEPCDDKFTKMTMALAGERPPDEIGFVERCTAHPFKTDGILYPCANYTTWIAEDRENGIY